MIFCPAKQPGYLYLSLPQPLSKVLKFLFSLHWLNLRCSHHLHFSPIYATFMQKQCCREPSLLPVGPAGMAAINASLAVGPESCAWGARKKGTHKCVTSPTVLQGGKLVWKHRYQHLQAYHSRALGMSVAPWSPYPVSPAILVLCSTARGAANVIFCLVTAVILLCSQVSVFWMSALICFNPIVLANLR